MWIVIPLLRHKPPLELRISARIQQVVLLSGEMHPRPREVRKTTGMIYVEMSEDDALDRLRLDAQSFDLCSRCFT